MRAVLSQQRLAPAIAASTVGIAVSWLMMTPFGLVAPIAALFLFARGRTALLLHAMAAAGLAGSLLLAGLYAGAMRDVAQAWAAFFAVALCIGVIVRSSEPASAHAEASTRTATPDETPSYPVVGPTPREKVAPRNSPVVSIAARDDKATQALMVAASFWGGTPFHLRYWRSQPDGSHRWTEIRTESLRELSGTQVWSGFSADVGDQGSAPQQPTKIASNPPRNDEAVQAAKIVERLLGNAWAFDATGRPTYLTPFAQAFVSVALEEFQASVDEGHTVFKRTSHPDEYDRIAAAWRHSLQTGDPFYIERRIRRASGIHDWSRTAIVPTRDRRGRITGWYGASMDLDAYRTVEVELLARERELSQLVDMVPSHIWRLTPDGDPVFFNKRMVDFLGFDIADTDKPGKSRLDAVIETVHPSDAPAFRDVLNRCFATGETFALRYRLRRADGVYRWMSSRAEPMRDQTGRIVQWYGLCHEIDDQVQAEDALRRSEQQLRQLIDAVPVMMWSTTREGRPSYVNKRFTDVTGATLEDITAPDGSFNLSVIHPDDKAATAEMVGRSFRTGVPYVMQYRQLRRGGSYRWTETRAEALRDYSGNIVQWYGVSVDIHDLVTAQQALRESEAQLRDYAETASDWFWEIGPDYKFTLLTENAFGSHAANRIGTTCWDHALDLETEPEKWRVVQATLDSRKPFRDFVYRGVSGSGSPMHVRASGKPVFDAGGRFRGYRGTGSDVTAIMRAQEALRDRERELSQLVDMVPVHIRRLTTKGEPTFFNKRLLDFFGFGDVSELDKPGMSRLVTAMRTLVHPDDSARLLETVRHSVATGEGYSMKYRMRRADGMYRWVDGRSEPLRDDAGAIVQWYAISIDIDDEVRAQEALRDRERELSQLVDMVPSLLWRLNPDGQPNFFNKRLIDFLGREVADHDKPGKSVHPDDAASVGEALNRSFVTGDRFSMKYRLRRADGVYRWVEGRAEPMRDQSGRIIQWYGLAHDIDDQMRAEQALRDRERELSQLVDMLPVAIARLGPDGDPTFFNKRLIDFLGLDVTDMEKPGMSRLAAAIATTHHPDEAADFAEALKHSLVTGEPFFRRYRQRRADGVYRWMEARAEPVRDENGMIAQWYGVSIDIDDEMRAQQAEEALRKTSDRLAKATQAASLAELSASIAHEVNQPLAAIVANSHACQRWLEVDPPNLDRAQKTVERIIRDANSAADVVGRIRALFSQSARTRNPAVLDSVIAEARSLMADEAARRHVRMDVDVESNLPLVAFDRVQVQQVLINLIRNGMEAMDSTAGDRVLGMRVRRLGDVVQTEISDRGRGVELLDKVFEPFFTTKQDGMGMGLAICRSIVQSHGGRLWAEKNEPQGATFIFTLPVETAP